MPTLPTTYKGDSWQNIRNQLTYAVDSLNGRVLVGGVYHPRLTNAQALAILQAWRKLLVLWKESPGAYWPELWYLALGYEREGDKFDMTTAHGAAPASDVVIAGTWQFAEDAARRLDGRKATPLLLVLNLSFAGYKSAAEDAYRALTKQRAKLKAKLKVPMPPGIDPPDVTLPAPPAPEPPFTGPVTPELDRGTGLLVLLAIIAIAIAVRKRN